MANPLIPLVNDDELDQTTDIGHEADDVVDATDQQDDEQDDDDDGDNSPNYGVAVRNVGVTRRGDSGLTVTQGGLSSGTSPAGYEQPRTGSGSIPAEPKLQSKAYEITKAGIKDRILKASYEETLVYQDMTPVKRVFDMKGGLPVHPDLQRCFDKLVPFLAHVTEQTAATPYILEAGQSVPPVWSNVVVDKVSIKDSGVVISGFRKLKGNRQFVLNSPFIDFNTDRDSWYSKAAEIEKLIQELKAEIVLALEGKAFNPQYGLFDEDKKAA